MLKLQSLTCLSYGVDFYYNVHSKSEVHLTPVQLYILLFLLIWDDVILIIVFIEMINYSIPIQRSPSFYIKDKVIYSQSLWLSTETHYLL